MDPILRWKKLAPSKFNLRPHSIYLTGQSVLKLTMKKEHCPRFALASFDILWLEGEKTVLQRGATAQVRLPDNFESILETVFWVLSGGSTVDGFFWWKINSGEKSCDTVSWKLSRRRRRRRRTGPTRRTRISDGSRSVSRFQQFKFISQWHHENVNI